MRNMKQIIFNFWLIQVLPPSAWEIVILEDKKNRLEWVVNVGADRLTVSYIEDVKNKLHARYPEIGERVYEMLLEIGTIHVETNVSYEQDRIKV
ncbi:Prolyl endopeptidase [Dirofilaria immitis]